MSNRIRFLVLILLTLSYRYVSAQDSHRSFAVAPHHTSNIFDEEEHLESSIGLGIGIGSPGGLNINASYLDQSGILFRMSGGQFQDKYGVEFGVGYAFIRRQDMQFWVIASAGMMGSSFGAPLIPETQLTSSDVKFVHNAGTSDSPTPYVGLPVGISWKGFFLQAGPSYFLEGGDYIFGSTNGPGLGLSGQFGFAFQL